MRSTLTGGGRSVFSTDVNGREARNKWRSSKSLNSFKTSTSFLF